jgi:hypothetical protein
MEFCTEILNYAEMYTFCEIIVEKKLFELTAIQMYSENFGIKERFVVDVLILVNKLLWFS